MLIYEEYLTRHKIAVPVVQRVNTGSFFHKVFGPTVQWFITSIKLGDPPESGPQVFNVSTHLTGFGGMRRSTQINQFTNIQWAEFDDFIMEWAKSVPPENAVFGEQNVELTAWELFVAEQESIFVKNYGSSSLLFETLDLTSSLEARYAAYQKLMLSVDPSRDPLYSTWEQRRQSYLRTYCHWLVDFIR